MANFKQVDRQYLTPKDARNVLEYIKAGCYNWGAPYMLLSDTEVIWAQMNYYKQYYGKTEGEQVKHFVLSFQSQKYESDITLSKLQRFANILAGLFREYQPVWAIHLHKTHTHLHLVINTVNVINGKRFHMSPGEFNQLLEKLADELIYYQVALLPVTYIDESGKMRKGKVPVSFLYQNKDPFTYK